MMGTSVVSAAPMATNWTRLEPGRKARTPGSEQLLKLAAKTGIKPKAAAESINRIATVSESFRQFVGDLPIREQTLDLIEKAALANRERLANTK